MMPFLAAMPKSVISPISEATLKTPPDKKMPKIPPISASGKIDQNDQRVAKRTERRGEQEHDAADDQDTQKGRCVCEASSALSNWPP